MAHPFQATSDHTVVALILAGGRGSRLAPLTDERSKPSVPFAGSYRLIDVALSNLANSGLRDVWVAEQYRPFTLNQHIAGGRPWDLDGTHTGLQLLPPIEGDDSDGFAQGNGHALAQQLPLLQEFGADTVVVLSADHLYRLDMRPVLKQHANLGSDLTMVTIELDEDVTRYGVVTPGPDGEVAAYDYKPESPASQVIATEIFVFKVDVLAEVAELLIDQMQHREDEDDPEGASLGDYGETILPYFVENKLVHEYRVEGYWRDIGTIDAFYQAHMELLRGEGLPLDDKDWQLITHPTTFAPAYVGPTAEVRTSLLAAGAQVNGSVEQSVIGPGVRVEAGARVYRSILLGDTVVPAEAQLESVIADVRAPIEKGTTGQTKPGPGNITVLVPAPSAGRRQQRDETLGR